MRKKNFFLLLIATLVLLAIIVSLYDYYSTKNEHSPSVNLPNNEYIVDKISVTGGPGITFVIDNTEYDDDN